MLLRAAPPEPTFLPTTLLDAGVVLMLLPDAEDHHDEDEDVAEPRPVPFGTVTVTHAGRSRRLAALHRPQRLPAEFVHRDVELDVLTAPLDAASRLRLLRFLLGFCRSAFRLGLAPGFAATCRRLALETLPCLGPATPVARLCGNLVLLRDVTAPAGAVLHVVGEAAAFTAGPRGDGTGPEPHWGGLQAVEEPGPGALLLAEGERGGYWPVVAAATGELPHVLRLLEGGGPGADTLRRACLRALAPLARPGTAAAALLQDVQLLSPAAARAHEDPASPVGGALELALPDGDGHLFLRGWLRDPLALVAGVSLLDVAGEHEVPTAALHRLDRPDLAPRLAGAAHGGAPAQLGFVARLPDASRGNTRQPQLRLRLHSGASVLLTPPPGSLAPAAARDAVLGSVAPAQATVALLDDCLAPAARALHALSLRHRPAPAVVRIGTRPARPAVSILVPVYRALGFLRFQVAALARDPALEGAELILALDSPEQHAELEHLLRGLYLLHGMPMTLLVMGRNLGFAAATNAAAAAARAPVLLLLNSDVVPAAPGWLPPMLAALRRPGVGAVGPKLLFDDDSIQHAGLFFERDLDGVWFNRHYHKGMPRGWPAAARPRLVPGVTGGALMLRTSTFEDVGGVDEDYVIGDYEDSDLCLRLQERGERIAYVPAAELYHFERRSIRLHRGYARTLAATYNRRLHHARWDGTMEAVMREASRPADRRRA